jgi:hypothetical protein
MTASLTGPAALPTSDDSHYYAFPREASRDGETMLVVMNFGAEAAPRLGRPW